MKLMYVKKFACVFDSFTDFVYSDRTEIIKHCSKHEILGMKYEEIYFSLFNSLHSFKSTRRSLHEVEN